VGGGRREVGHVREEGGKTDPSLVTEFLLPLNSENPATDTNFRFWNLFSDTEFSDFSRPRGPKILTRNF
jgi:hypothetical protein